MVGILKLKLYLPGVTSLKEKRSRLKPLLHRLHREFNVSVCEFDKQDAWKDTLIACAWISNNAVHCQQSLQEVVKFIPLHFRDIEIIEHSIEII